MRTVEVDHRTDIYSYGILAYDNWNIMHMCLGAGLHPFKDKTDEEVERFEEVARAWINGATSSRSSTAS